MTLIDTHLPHLGVDVVQLLVARVDPDLVVERRQVVAPHDYEVFPPQLQRTEVLLDLVEWWWVGLLVTSPLCIDLLLGHLK